MKKKTSYKKTIHIQGDETKAEKMYIQTRHATKAYTQLLKLLTVESA